MPVRRPVWEVASSQEGTLWEPEYVVAASQFRDVLLARCGDDHPAARLKAVFDGEAKEVPGRLNPDEFRSFVRFFFLDLAATGKWNADLSELEPEVEAFHAMLVDCIDHDHNGFIEFSGRCKRSLGQPLIIFLFAELISFLWPGDVSEETSVDDSNCSVLSPSHSSTEPSSFHTGRKGRYAPVRSSVRSSISSLSSESTKASGFGSNLPPPPAQSRVLRSPPALPLPPPPSHRNDVLSATRAAFIEAGNFAGNMSDSMLMDCFLNFLKSFPVNKKFESRMRRVCALEKAPIYQALLVMTVPGLPQQRLSTSQARTVLKAMNTDGDNTISAEELRLWLFS